MNRLTLKLKIPLPESSNVYAEKDDKAVDLLLYEADQLEILEEVRMDTKKVHFHAKDGQYINKGDIVFTEGLLGHKAMVADFSGILEIKDGVCRILGQKRHFEKRINIEGVVTRVIPNKYVELKCNVYSIRPTFYNSFKNKLTNYIYIENKKEITEDLIRSNPTNLNTTYFINDNLYVDDLAKIVALGVRRLIVNSIYLDNFQNFKREIAKLEGFAIISGFGEIIAKKLKINDPKMDVFWGKTTIYLSDDIDLLKSRIFEHPFWGLTGEFKRKNDLISELDYNGEKIDFYLKNLEVND